MNSSTGVIGKAVATATSRRSKGPRRRSFEDTEKKLLAAIQVLLGNGEKVRASTVAKIVGVDPSLIPNVYKAVQARIKSLNGDSPQAKLKGAANELAMLESRLAEVSAELEKANTDLTQLSSINLTLNEQILALTKESERAAGAEVLEDMRRRLDEGAKENQMLRNWLLETQAQLRGKPISSPKSEGANDD